MNDKKGTVSIHDYSYTIGDEEQTKDRYHNKLNDHITEDDEHNTTLFPTAEELYTFLTADEMPGKNRNIFNHFQRIST
ncbi:hypothetical protein PFDG_05315 [Plasmodium falciparum Dd2]|uniref:Uncharacterized protein n=1 Tax=Plasmodium falciparum (isolate Dd2) TaxID=57267 RepID=A0A0L7MA83_PLAF4|nr:hypothetical protein PFDG_05315 [Plasmodium falciparum Dd2]